MESGPSYLSIVFALLLSLCLCYFVFLFPMVFSALMVVLLLWTVTQDGFRGNDEEAMRWCPCFLPVLATVVPLFYVSVWSRNLTLCFPDQILVCPSSCFHPSGSGGYRGGDEEAMRWCPCFWPVFPSLFPLFRFCSSVLGGSVSCDLLLFFNLFFAHSSTSSLLYELALVFSCALPSTVHIIYIVYFFTCFFLCKLPSNWHLYGDCSPYIFSSARLKPM